MTHNITLRFSASLDCYGDDATEADRGAMNRIMAEYLEDLGYVVEIGIDTGHGNSDHTWDRCGTDDNDELQRLASQAWDYACANYLRTIPSAVSAPDPAHEVAGNGIESHYDLARQLEMRGYDVDADADDNEHSYVRFDAEHVGDIHGDSIATVTTKGPKR